MSLPEPIKHLPEDWDEDEPLFYGDWQCEYPGGCDRQAVRGWRLCGTHYDAISSLFAPA